ncbi:MAG: STAS domain-containing protein [bacterium]
MIKIVDKSTQEVSVFALEGKLTGLEGRGIIQDKVRDSIKSKMNKIVLDMSKVTWIDSTGLGELIASLSSIKKNDGNLVLTNIQAPVHSLLKMTNLNQIFETFETVEDAVKEFG